MLNNEINLTINMSNQGPNLVGKDDFAKYIRKKRKQYNDLHPNQISTKSLGEMLGIDYEMFRKILNQQKPTKKRDLIIAIGIILKMNPQNISYALRLYQYMPSLDTQNARDTFIITQITQKKAASIKDLNQSLKKNGFPELDLYDKRTSTIKKAQNITMIQPYSIIETKVRTPVLSDYYYDKYNSLASRFSPYQYRCGGDMIIHDSETGNNIHLFLDSSGYLSSQNLGNEKDYNTYPSINDSGNFKAYFLELNASIMIEKQRLLAVLNDTKNYKKRSSANFANDNIVVFAEEYNFFIPEMNEYYVCIYSNGNYKFLIYDTSAFMSFYLTPDEYDKTYGNKDFQPINVYTSMTEINNLSLSTTRYEEKIKFDLQKKIFLSLQSDVYELYNKIKQKEVFIRNISYIYDNPFEAIYYFKAEEQFKCIRDEEFQEIIHCNKSASFPLNSTNQMIEITVEDIFEAFSLGFNSIEEICSIKHSLGSISAVIK